MLGENVRLKKEIRTVPYHLLDGVRIMFIPRAKSLITVMLSEGASPLGLFM